MLEDLGLGQLTGSPLSVPLGFGPAPEQVLSRLGRWPHPGALWGDWFDGSVIALHSPLVVVTPREALAAAQLLDQQPQVSRATGVLGGGWLACLGFTPGTSWVGFYDCLLRWRRDGSWTFESLGLDGRAAETADALASWRLLLKEAAHASAARSWQISTFRTQQAPRTARHHHLAAVERVIGRIGRGDFYQVNLCTRLRADFTGDAVAMFAQTAAQLQPSWGALVTAGTGDRPKHIASMSPELFLRVADGRVTTSPIKGTAPRTEDETAAEALRSSTKDAAENIMIVDLMRNDLSRVCRTGTVVVEELLALQAHPGVWHLVSTISGELRPGTTTADLLSSTFPPGSVTGAPKLAALKAIDQLEAQGRGAYTGSIGFSSSVSGSEFNVLIRSYEISDTSLEVGVGGGVTVESVPVREWYECLQKAAPLVTAAGASLDPQLHHRPVPPPSELIRQGVFETILAHGPDVLRLAAHLGRLDRSCLELYGRGVPDGLSARVLQAVARLDASSGRHVVRIVARPADHAIDFTVTLTRLGPRLVAATLARADRSDVQWRHKWVDRTELTAAEAAAAPAHPYFVTGGGEVTETSRGSLFCRGEDGVWRTPPLGEDLLPGVTRRAVLDLFSADSTSARVEPVEPGALQTCRGAFWASSLSGAVMITAVDGILLPSAEDVTAQVNRALGFDPVQLRGAKPPPIGGL